MTGRKIDTYEPQNLHQAKSQKEKNVRGEQPAAEEQSHKDRARRVSNGRLGTSTFNVEAKSKKGTMENPKKKRRVKYRKKKTSFQRALTMIGNDCREETAALEFMPGELLYLSCFTILGVGS